MNMKYLLVPLTLALAGCGEKDRIAGNGSDIGNGLAAGRVVHPDGTPAKGAWVECIPNDRAPWESRRPGWTAMTDSVGGYVCRELPSGAVGVSSYDAETGLTRWHLDTSRTDASNVRNVDTLAAPGRMRIALPPGSNGNLYLSGLGVRLPVQGEAQIEFSSIPAGWSGTLYFARSTTESVRLDSGLHVDPGAVDSVGFTAGTSNLRIPLAGGLTATVRALPVLVRLDSSWHGFGNTLADGSDLRLKSATGASLPITVASWDKSSRTGSFWTFFDSIAAPGDSIDLVLDYGLPVVDGAPREAFTTTGGWTAVWPLGDTGSVARERLGRFPGGSTGLATVSGIAGNASRFDGLASKVVVAGTAGGSLGLPNKGPYTMSCWAKLRTYTFSRFVMGYGDRNTALKYVGSTSSNNKNTWQLRDFRDAPVGVNFVQGAADTAVWSHLAATVDGDSVRFFINGVRQSAAVAFDRSDLPRSAVDFAIGVSLDSLGVGSYYFPGDLSEVWVHSLARSPDWIRFAAANQKLSAPVARTIR